MLTKNQTLQPGMSFIEITIVIAIMAMFLAMVGPRVLSVLGRGKKAATQSILNGIVTGIKQYKIDTGTYPNSLEDLVKKPEGVTGWQEPYVGREDIANPTVPQDAWNGNFEYKLNPRGSTPAYELYSKGDPDKAEEERIYAK